MNGSSCLRTECLGLFTALAPPSCVLVATFEPFLAGEVLTTELEVMVGWCEREKELYCSTDHRCNITYEMDGEDYFFFLIEPHATALSTDMLASSKQQACRQHLHDSLHKYTW